MVASVSSGPVAEASAAVAEMLVLCSIVRQEYALQNGWRKFRRVREHATFPLHHLEGEAKKEIQFRCVEDPAQGLVILTELYGCSQSNAAGFLLLAPTGGGNTARVFFSSYGFDGKMTS